MVIWRCTLGAVLGHKIIDDGLEASACAAMSTWEADLS